LAWFSDLTSIRFRLGHDKLITSYLENSRVFTRVDDLESTLIKDKLQSSSTAIAVWLGGPVPQSSSLDNIADILLDSPRFKKHNISILFLSAEIMHVTPGPLGRKRPKVKGLHSHCAKTEKSRVRKLLKMVYPSLPAKDYPRGIQMRAIENTADPDFPVPKRARVVADRMRTKQNHLLKSLIVTQYDHFKNIHSTIAHPKEPILSQLLYNWRSSEDPSQRLFVMVEQDFEECPTKFSYLSALQDEVSAILPVLPLILVGLLGPEAAAWFMPSHTLGTDGYRYDAPSDRVVPIDSGSTIANIDRNWEQSDEGFTGHADIAADDDDSYHGLAIDIGDFSLDQPSRSRILGDDTASVATLGIPQTHDDDDDDDYDVAANSNNPDDMDVEDANTTIGSSLTDPAPHLDLNNSLVQLLSNTSLDPAIHQAILASQSAVETAGGKS
jgi:hypothetical protein